MKRFFSLLFAALAIVLQAGAATVYTYTYTPDGGSETTLYFTVSNSNATICNSSGTSETTSYTTSSIVIPETVYKGETGYKVTAIDKRAFWNCTSVTSVSLPSTVTSIGSYAFRGCTGLATIDLNGANLTGLPSCCFYGCSSLKSIDLSGCTNLSVITNNAFYNCTALESINLPSSLEKLTEIDSYAFYSCSKLSGNIDLSSCTALKYIDQHAFQNCSSLEGINLSGCTALTSIGTYAFSGCSKLSGSINLDSCTALTSIGSYAFNNCSLLTSIDLSKCTALTTIYARAFSYCTSLTSIDLSECTSLATINEYAFSYCTSLANVSLPSSVTSIGACAFNRCIAKIKFYGETPPTFGTAPIQQDPDNADKSSCTVYVPPFGLEAYKAAENMSTYASYIYPFSDQTVSATAGVGTLALPFTATIPTGITAYEMVLSSDGTQVVGTAIGADEDGTTTLPAGTPVCIVPSDTETYGTGYEWLGTENVLGSATTNEEGNTSYYTAADTVMMGNLLVGVFRDSTITSNGRCYVLQKKSGEDAPKFYKVPDGTSFKMGAFRAYLDLDDSSAESISFTLLEDSDVTGIANATTAEPAATGIYYDLQGRAVGKPAKGGIYVKDGKKIIL